MSGGTDIPGILEFRATAMHVEEQTGAPGVFADTTVLARDKAFFMSADFFIDRWLGKGLNDLPPVGPSVFEYNVTYYAESIGPGAEYKFPAGPASVTHAIACIKNQYSYSPAQTRITIPANTMQEGEYRLTCRVKMSPIAGPLGSQGFPWHVVAFVEGPTITVYQP
jgi:hypothetical protein